MRMIGRSLTGIFLASLTLAMLGLAGRTIVLAVLARMADAPPAFAARERLPTVEVLTVTAATVVPELTLYGELRARRVLDLRAGSGGNVVWLSPAFVEGGRVTAGMPLLRLDPVAAQTALTRAEVDQNDAVAEVRDADRALGLERETLIAAQAQAALREQALQRQRDLQDRGIGTAPDLESAELAASAAAQAVLLARQSIARAEARIDQAATAQARGDIARAEAARALTETELTAPFDGVLTGVSLVQGARVSAAEALGQLIDPQTLDLAFRVSTAQYGRLLDPTGALIRAEVTARLDTDGAELSATLSAIGRITREASGDSAAGRLIFAELGPAAGLRPGDFVTVNLREPPLNDAARLPATALGTDGTVLVLDAEDRLSAQPVTLLRRIGDTVIVAADGIAGARIVAERSPLIGAGLRVRPAGADTPPAPAAAMIDLTEERRARLVAYVTESTRMPPEAKSALLVQLEQPQVSADVVQRLESRMGG